MLVGGGRRQSRYGRPIDVLEEPDARYQSGNMAARQFFPVATSGAAAKFNKFSLYSALFSAMSG